MTQRNIVNVVGDMESFLDSLLAHAEEENCQHTISDFLREYFDNKNKIGVGRPETSSNNQQQANDSNLQPTHKEGEINR
jgi:hypothetical protein